MKSFAKLAALMLIVALNSLPLTANAYTKIGTCSQKEKILVQKHITNQIAALKREDWETAYGYAAPAFRKAIPIDLFKEVLKKQYVFLIMNDRVSFGTCASDSGSFSQILNLTYRGQIHTLSYVLTQTNNRLGVLSANEIKPLRGTNA